MLGSGATGVSGSSTRVTRSFLQVQPHETRGILFHELVALLVDFVVLLVSLGAFRRVFHDGIAFLQRRLESLLPGWTPLLVFLGTYTLRQSDKGDGITNEQVQFAVPVHVSDPDPRAAGGAGEFVFAEEFPIFDLTARLD